MCGNKSVHAMWTLFIFGGDRDIKNPRHQPSTNRHSRKCFRHIVYKAVQRCLDGFFYVAIDRRCSIRYTPNTR